MAMRGRDRIGIEGDVDIEGLVMIYESHVYFNAALSMTRMTIMSMYWSMILNAMLSMKFND